MAIDHRAVPDRMPVMGNPDAPIVVVCDSPTLAQWRAKIPIGGRSVEFWYEHVIQAGFKEDDFCYVSPCAPIPDQVEGSDKREKAFIDEYRDALRATLDTLTGAKLYIYLGKNADYALTGKPVKITKQRGVARAVDGIAVPVLPLYSPGHVLRRPENLEIFEADMHMLEILRDGDYRMSAVSDTIMDTHYEWRDDLSDILDNRPSSMSFDTEGKGLKWYVPETRLLTVQFSWREGHAVCVPWTNWENNPYGSMSLRKQAKIKGQVKLLMEDPKIKKSAHNLKFDVHMMQREGIAPRGLSIDTQLLAFFIDENMFEKSQDECVRRWVPEMAGYADAFNQNPIHVGKTCMERVPPDMLIKYAGGDADANFRLAKRCLPILRQDARQWNCYTRVQWPALRAFMEVVEPAGIKINTTELAELETTLRTETEREYKELLAMVPPVIKRKHLAEMKGRQTPQDVLSFSRDNFVRDILFTKEGFGLKPVVFTKTTAKLGADEQIPSVSTKTHLPYFDHPFVPKLTRYQKVSKLQNTYVGLPEHEEDGLRGEKVHVPASGFWKYLDEWDYIHPSFILHRTVTGRTASAQDI